MTLLLAWAAFDDGKTDPSALYIATDSRISWGNKSTWDLAQKVFCVPQSNEIFGYCGDVMCVTQTLSQIVHLCSQNGFDCLEKTDERICLYTELIRDALASYPKEQIVSGSSIIYARRHDSLYAIYEIEIAADATVSSKEVTLARRDSQSKPENREDRIVRGSGTTMFKGKLPSETTYQAFHRFCECIEDETISSVGGFPQVVTLRRNGHGSVLGVCIKGRNHVLGLPVNLSQNFSGILEWKNENFERWNPETNEIIQGAKRQPRIQGINSSRKLPR